MFFLKYLCAIFVALIMMQNHSLSDQKKKKFQISTENQKLLLTFPKTAKNKLEDALEDINKNCCEANFQNQAKVEKIKTTIKKCLNEKCYTYMFPVYNPLKPPLKITALKNIQNLDDLILENQRTKYENMLENVVSKNTNELRSEKLKSEKNKKGGEEASSILKIFLQISCVGVVSTRLCCCSCCALCCCCRLCRIDSFHHAAASLRQKP